MATTTNAPDGVSLAVSGKGTSFKIQTAATGGTGGGPTLTSVAELKTLEFSGSKNNWEDVTNFDSAGRAEEFEITTLSAGEIKITGNYITSDVGQAAFRAAFAAGTKINFEIVLPLQGAQTTTGEMWEFLGAVTELDNSIAYNKVLQWSATVKISGLIDVTPGT